MTMIISSAGMCQEICHHENIDQFAVKVGARFAKDTTYINFLCYSNLICLKMNNIFLFYVDESMFMH